jgi:UDP-N-acetylmuramyl pentapeptide synthase
LRRELLELSEEAQRTKVELQITATSLAAMTTQNQQHARDLEESQSAIQEAKAMISTAQRENEIAVKAFHDSDRANKLQITTLQEQLRDKTKEMEDLQAMHTIRIDEKNQREREFQQTILTKDDRIREVGDRPSLLSHLAPGVL